MAQRTGAFDSGATGVRRADVVAALSLATDLAMGQPMAFALRSCVVAVRLGEELGFDAAQLGDVYYEALLRYIGCNAETHVFAALFGDELELRRDFATIDPGKLPDVLGMLARRIGAAHAGTGTLHLAGALARGIAAAPSATHEAFAGHCEVAQRLAERLGFGPLVIRALGQIYERWDGRGQPNGLKGEAILPAVRVVSLVQDAQALHDAHGADAMLAIVRGRRRTAYDPVVVDRFCASAARSCGVFASEPTWDEVLALEPGVHATFTDAELARACVAIADFTDLKSPYTAGHSRGVAALAARAAERCGIGRSDAATVELAGYVHDVGSVAISSGIWCKAGALGEAETERVRMHAYYTERVLARSPGLARLGAIAGHHHERLDGTGYHRAARGAALTPAAKILAAADSYQAMTETRPHRPALSADAAAATLQREVREGRLDPDAANAVLASAGHAPPRAGRELVAGLTERELFVLRLLAAGMATKQVAARLQIAPKTADNHIQSVYSKIGVSTRAGATLYAIEHGLTGSFA